MRKGSIRFVAKVLRRSAPHLLCVRDLRGLRSDSKDDGKSLDEEVKHNSSDTTKSIPYHVHEFARSRVFTFLLRFNASSLSSTSRTLDYPRAIEKYPELLYTLKVQLILDQL